ncbi:helix-turn-helix transcriptional regulator [Gelidibacter gilvus]|uniref:AraC family transcriptional regulator n=1 Tax=Gelidibacter gilvus TaxID=59602 RepID=A0A4Q0XFX6_9FLAO|nr:AraC family transcriptional regulator [Gelidibacter gilvus]RXJ49603.1 AraC family transcriptional regulator [Gelidibacter gilvus]
MNGLYSFEIREGQTSNGRYFKGSIERYALNDHIEFYGFELKALHDFTIYLKSEKDSALYMCFNLAPKSPLTLNCDTNNIVIPSFSSVLIPNNESETMSFNCDPHTSYDFLILRIQRSHLTAEQLSLFQSLQQDTIFMDVSTPERVLLPNLELCEMARRIKNIDKTTCENKFIAQGYSHILMGLKIKEFLSCSNKMGVLQPFEIQQLKNISEEIKENPQHEYSIKELCKKTGLSVSKLQLGFKEMHQCTVAIFIRNQRLEKALVLLRNTNLNVSEIVYSVGLTSRSYFCRIFKKRFKCTPKCHQQKLKESLRLVS